MPIRRWLEALVQDLRYSLRVLRRDLTFTATTVLTLALGIGASTAIFTVVDAALLNPLPYEDAGQIYRVRTINAQGLPLGTLGKTQIDPLNEQNGSVLAAAYGYSQESSIVGRDSLTYSLNEQNVSDEFFRVFTDAFTLGRSFEPDDGDYATVLSYRIWRDVFESDPDIVGSVVHIGDSEKLVVGVAGPDFEFPAGTGAWNNMYTGPGTEILTNMDAYARLKPGYSGEQFQAELDALAGRLPPWQDGRAVEFVSVSLLKDILGDFSSTVVTLTAAVAILLLIACLNAAILLFTRGTTRAREIALRGALGAARPRVVRQLLTETCALAVLGGVIGLALATAAVRVSSAIGLAGLPRLETLSIDRNVFLFATTCVVVTAFAVGLAPALRRSRGDLTVLINDGGRGNTGGPNRRRLFGTLVVAEVALAVMLVIAAGLLVRSYAHLMTSDPGFDPDRLLTVLLDVRGRVDKPPTNAGGVSTVGNGSGTGYLPVARFYQDFMGRIRAMPGVESVSATSHVPLNPGRYPVSNAPFMLPDEPFIQNVTPLRQTQVSQVSPNYFASMGVRPDDGRLFAPSDRRDAPGVAIVNEAFVRFVYGDDRAVGQNLILPGAGFWAPGGLAFQIGEMTTDTFEIVGVIPDIPQTSLWIEPEPAVYFPQEQWTLSRMAVVVRTEFEDPGSLIPQIRDTLAQMDPTIPPIFTVYSDVLSEAVARQRLGAALLTSFGLAALLLAAVGIYGLMSYSVAQRRSEMAVRTALGARSADMRGMIMAWALRLAVVGTGLGLAGAWATRTIIASQLYEISALDPLVFATVPVAMLVLAVVSAYVPARRAAGIDPAVALRSE